MGHPDRSREASDRVMTECVVTYCSASASFPRLMSAFVVRRQRAISLRMARSFFV
jgi:hypothetical protein